MDPLYWIMFPLLSAAVQKLDDAHVPGEFHHPRGKNGAHDHVAEIETACRTLAPLLGLGAAGLFMLALLASGFSSSIVGVMAGQVIMQGFVSFRIPLWFRRLVVMAPSFAVVAAGMDITHALVLSQVVLSLVLPIPMVALVRFTARRDVMGVRKHPPDKHPGGRRNRFCLPPQRDPAVRDRGPRDPDGRRLSTLRRTFGRPARWAPEADRNLTDHHFGGCHRSPSR